MASGRIEAEQFRENIGFNDSQKLEFLGLSAKKLDALNISILSREHLKKSTGSIVRLDVQQWPKIRILVDSAVDANIDNGPKINYEIARCVGYARTAKEHIGVTIAGETNKQVSHDRLLMDKQAKVFALCVLAPEKEIAALLMPLATQLSNKPMMSKTEAVTLSNVAAEKVMKRFDLPRHAAQDASMAYFATKMREFGVYVPAAPKKEEAAMDQPSQKAQDVATSGKFKNDAFAHMLENYRQQEIERGKSVEDVDFNKLAKMNPKDKGKAFERER
jgi:hypothetical protein